MSDKELKKEAITFWAEDIASEIINRQEYKYVNKKIKKPKEFVVKTSASLSGVLHIGRLSDTIRSETVYRALKNLGVKARIIWVAEDMDPLRKIPKGVPKTFEKYLGCPVSDIPDPFGCHENYAEHFKAEYFKVIDEFVYEKLPKYSMREEYKKGSFNEFIKKILEQQDLAIEIQNKYRTESLKKGYSNWKPICENCGKIITPRVTRVENGLVHYECKDYSFAKTRVKGCGYKGSINPLKGGGKLMWKGEWAAQWARWKVSTEGAGVEYSVPLSAWWVNAEIVEKIFDYPMPVPIFYGHLFIDGKKMSASLGNVVFPHEFLKCSRPELLKFLYNKRLLKTRSFSWKDLAKLHDDFDKHARVYYGVEEGDTLKETGHMKKLYSYSSLKKVLPIIPITYSYAATLAQIYGSNKEEIIKALKATGHYNKKVEDLIFERIRMAKNWVENYEIPDEINFVLVKIILSKEEKNVVNDFINVLEKSKDYEIFQKRVYSLAKNIGMKKFFQIMYKALFNKEKGPKLAIFAWNNKKKVLEHLKKY